MRFLTTLQPPPAGFEVVLPTRRNLASGSIVVLVREMGELQAAFPGFADGMVGCVVTVSTRLGLEQVGKHVWHLTAPPGREAEVRDLARAIACLASECSAFEERLALQDISVQRLSSDLVTTREDYNRSIATLYDKVAEEAALRDQLETFFSIAPDLLCCAGMDGVFRKLSSSWLAFGHSLAELTSRSCLDFVHPDDVEATQEAFARLAEGHDVAGFVNRYRCADGTYRELEWHTRPHGEQIFGTARDITERRESEARHAEMQRQLLRSQKLESLGVLAGGIAHDFNNLLAAIIGNLDLAMMRLPQDSPARLGIERAVQASGRAAELTRQMLAYAGKGQFVIRRFDLNRLLHENSHLLGVLVPKNVSLSLDLAPRLPEIEGDRAQVQQVVTNLVANGAEAIGERVGSLHLTTGSQWCNTAYLRRSRLDELAEEGVFVWLEVEDTGCGMDDETQARLFDPFFTTKFTGRGLGMSAVLGIVRAHRGAIMLDTLVGRGTRIRILLPAVPSEVDLTTGPGVQPPGLDEFSGVVLVADEDASVRETCVSMLEGMGFSVLQACHGMEAVELFQERGQAVVLVVLDLELPRLDGARAFERMRALHPAARVIISSGYEESQVEGRVPGAAGFIQKPYRFQDLRHVIGLAMLPSDSCPAPAPGP